MHPTKPAEPVVVPASRPLPTESESVTTEFRSVTLAEIEKHGFVLTPGRYVGAEEVEEDAEPFAEKMARLVGTLRQQQQEGAKLDATIAENLRRLGYGE